MAPRNWEIAVYALYVKGGVSRHVHTEDVAVKCFEIAPESFSWTKHPEYPDKDIVRVALTDARKDKMGRLVIGRSGRGRGHDSGGQGIRRQDGWQLTESGATWISRNEERLTRELGQGESKRPRQKVLQRLERIRTHALFGQFQDSHEGFTPSIGPLAELLRCRADAENSVWHKRFTALRNDAQLAEQNDLLEFIRVCEGYIESRRG